MGMGPRAPGSFSACSVMLASVLPHPVPQFPSPHSATPIFFSSAGRPRARSAASAGVWTRRATHWPAWRGRRACPTACPPVETEGPGLGCRGGRPLWMEEMGGRGGPGCREGMMSSALQLLSAKLQQGEADPSPGGCVGSCTKCLVHKLWGGCTKGWGGEGHPVPLLPPGGCVPREGGA